MNFAEAISRVLGNEGGYTNTIDQETNWGFTWPKLREGIALGLVPSTTTIASLTREQAVLLYDHLFWRRIHADELYDGVAYQTLDFAVHSGIEVAIRKLQLALAVADDGHWGPITRAAARAMSESDQIMRLVAYRQLFETSLSTFGKWGKGWMVRNAKDLLYGAQDS